MGIDQDGSDISYFVEAKIGSKADPVYLLCDTGAGSTWIMGSDCTSTACQSHTTWSTSDSTTYAATGETFSIAYGTGSVSGALAQDSISIASVKLTMDFGVANVTSADFNHFAFDGILGLSMADGSSDNFINTLKSAKTLTSNVFGVNLNRHTDCLNTGELTFGGTDSSKFTGDFTYTAVNSDAGGDWAIAMDNVGYNGKKAGITNRLAYIDTGTTYAFAPSADVVALHKLIPGASSTDNITYTAPCDSEQSITVTFSGVDREISVKDWLSSPSSSGICTSNIYGREVVTGAWLLGDVFLKNVYTVFDADASRVGELNSYTFDGLLSCALVADLFPGFATKNSTATSCGSTTTTTSSASSTATSSSSSSSTSSSTAAAESAGASKTTVAASGARMESSIRASHMLCAVALVAIVAI